MISKSVIGSSSSAGSNPYRNHNRTSVLERLSVAKQIVNAQVQLLSEARSAESSLGEPLVLSGLRLRFKYRVAPPNASLCVEAASDHEHRNGYLLVLVIDD